MMRAKLLISLIPVLGVQLLVAQIPQTISYQGVLTDDADPPNPLNGPFVLRFKLYDVETNGTPLGSPEWIEDLSAIVTQGVFSVILGETTSFSSAGVYFTDPYWLEISIVEDGGSTVRTLAPLVQLSAVPYAIKSRGVSGSSNIFRGSGNVGIGTTSPFDMLDVAGNIRINDSDIFFRGGTDFNHGIGWYGDAKTFDGVSVDGPVLYGSTGGGLGTTSDGANVALYWDQAGNVGIGTTSPNTKLEVEGAIDEAVLVKLNQTGGINWVGLNLERDDVQKWHIGMNGTDDFLRFRRASTSDDMVIDAAGNVGIGTDIPSAKLDVAGDANIGGNLAVSGTITQAAQTRYYSFSPNDGAGANTWTNNYVEAYNYELDMEEALTVAIPLHLPHGATITGVTIYLDDNDTGNDMACDLYSLNFADYTLLEIFLTPEASASYTGSGQQTASTAVGLSLQVDNQAKRYWLRVEAGEPATLGEYNRFYGGYITYTVN